MKTSYKIIYTFCIIAGSLIYYSVKTVRADMAKNELANPDYYKSKVAKVVESKEYSLPRSVEFRVISDCKDFITNRLKSPSSAEFSDEQTMAFNINPDSNMVHYTASVDSMNSFGAKIRSKFRCSFSYDGDFNNGILKIVTTNGRTVR